MAVTPAVEIPGIDLEYAFSIRINFKERVRYETPAGHRVYVPADSGEVWGPRLNGLVVPRSGGDYAGVYGLNAHYMLQADDGTYIYIHNRGYLYRTDGQETDIDDPTWGGDTEFYFRIQPMFDTEKGPHEWLTRTLIVGTGQRHSDPDHTIFTYYEVK
jgi:hypothetical protein